MIVALLRSLLRLALPADDRDCVVADLDDEGAQLSASRGPAAARRWLVREYLLALWPALRTRRYRRQLAWRRQHPHATAQLSPLDRITANMFAITRDLRHAARRLVRTPASSALIIAILAAALGATTSVFAIVDAVLLRPLPYTEPDRLTVIWGERNAPDTVRVRLSMPDYFDYLDRARTMASVAGVGETVDANLAFDDQALPLRVTRASANFFELLGVEAARGRVFTDASVASGETGVVISHELWQSALGGDETVLSGSLLVDGSDWNILGVLPPGFRLVQSAADGGRGATGTRPTTDVWTAGILDNGMRGAGGHMRTLPMVNAIGRLAPGATVEQAREEFASIAAALRAEHPEHAAAGSSAGVAPMHAEVVGDIRPVVVALLSLVSIVLLIACANTAGLLLARADSRTRETAIRAAIGGGRWALARPLLAESLLLSVTAAAAAVLASRWLLGSLRVAGHTALPGIGAATIDLRILGAVGLATAITLVVVAAVPGWRVARFDVARLLTRSAAGAGGRRLATGDLIIVAEVALTTVLVLASALMLRTVQQLSTIDLGYDADRVVAVRVAMPSGAYRRGPERIAFLEQVAEQIRALPGIEAAGAVWPAPLAGTGLATRYGATEEAVESFASIPARYHAATVGLFATLEVQATRGRLIEAADLVARADVAVISEGAAREAFGEADPVGRALWVNVDEVFQRQLQVIGVVPDLRAGSLRADPQPAIYLPYGTLTAQRNTWLIARTTLPRQVPALGDAVRAIDPEVAIAEVRVLHEFVDEQLLATRAATAAISAFGVFALILAAAGLHGVVAATVLRRRREIGIRMALGAGAGRVVRQVVAHPVRLALVGGGLGILAALEVNRVLASLLFGVEASDPAAYAAVGTALLLIASVASALPAWRAVAVRPVDALRLD